MQQEHPESTNTISFSPSIVNDAVGSALLIRWGTSEAHWALFPLGRFLDSHVGTHSSDAQLLGTRSIATRVYPSQLDSSTGCAPLHGTGNMWVGAGNSFSQMLPQTPPWSGSTE